MLISIYTKTIVDISKSTPKERIGASSHIPCNKLTSLGIPLKNTKFVSFSCNKKIILRFTLFETKKKNIMEEKTTTSDNNSKNKDASIFSHEGGRVQVLQFFHISAPCTLIKLLFYAIHYVVLFGIILCRKQA